MKQLPTANGSAARLVKSLFRQSICSKRRTKRCTRTLLDCFDVANAFYAVDRDSKKLSLGISVSLVKSFNGTFYILSLKHRSQIIATGH